MRIISESLQWTRTTLELPEGTKFLRLEMVNDWPTAWFLVPDRGKPRRHHIASVAPHEQISGSSTYLGMVRTPAGGAELHFIEIKTEEVAAGEEDNPIPDQPEEEEKDNA